MALPVLLTVWVSPTTHIATAAAISDGLNSNESIPALNFHPPSYDLLLSSVIAHVIDYCRWRS